MDKKLERRERCGERRRVIIASGAIKSDAPGTKRTLLIQARLLVAAPAQGQLAPLR